MQPDDLSGRERATLFVLLGEARELTNPELQEVAGFRLDGKERRRLNSLKLVASRKAGRTFAHELTDAGWHWCATYLTPRPQRKATISEGAALYAILGGIARHMEAGQLSLADVFRSRGGEKPDIEALITQAYHGLAGEPGAFVKIGELRAQLPDIPRADLDSALEIMYRAQQVNLIPQANQEALTDADRQSALRVGGESKHMLSVR